MSEVREQRRYRRYHLQVPATLVHGKKTWRLGTTDVSVGGMFLRVADPPGLRQLVKVQVDMPQGGKLDAHAMVVWRLAPGGETPREPGIGLQFFALTRQDASRWEALVKGLRRPNGSPPTGEHPAAQVAPGKSRYPRYAGLFEVRPKDSGALMTMFTRDVSAGGMFVTTSQVAPIGSQIEIDLVHPENEAVFALSAVVRRIEARQGLGIEFVDLDEARRSLLWEFIRSGLPEPNVQVDGDGLPLP